MILYGSIIDLCSFIKNHLHPKIYSRFMNAALLEDDHVIDIPRETQYWFVRTDGGQYFDAFFNHGFIGIDWNYITINLMQPQFESRSKEMIAEREKLDIQSLRGKTLVSAAYNKIIRFGELKKGDVIIIPSRGSNELAFGIIDDDSTYWSEEFQEECPYNKRRKVKWILRNKLRNLDPKFFEIRITRHAISEITTYADYIDRAMLTFFKKNETATLVLDILQEEDIQLEPLMDLINGIQQLLHNINDELNLNENLEGNVIKLNLQSKGLLAVASKAVKSLAILGLVWALESCGTVDAEKANEVGMTEQQIIDLHQKIRPSIKSFDATMDTLQADKDKLAKTFSEK